ncbi:MAG TPA: hypothetical protein VHV78_06040 [Gemmatimonadaceae bacterium]|nr:hypothetical protein [Gemmatimonadaceae bacterium]
MSFLRAAALLAALALPAAGQQSDNSFHWSGRIPAGRWIRVRNLNGSITVGPASGDNVEVIGTKHWRRGNPADVTFDTQKYGPGNESVVICALWGSRSSCDDRHSESHDDRGTRNNDVSVDFQVLVPKGVKVGVNTVNGAVTVDGASAEVDAATVNGELDVATTGGPVNASNVNGGIRVRFGRVDSDANMDMTTVNGSISVEFPGDFGGDVDLETVNGGLNTNFPMTVSGRLNPKHLRAHIGKSGGPRLRLVTVNGSVELKKQ